MLGDGSLQTVEVLLVRPTVQSLLSNVEDDYKREPLLGGLGRQTRLQ